MREYIEGAAAALAYLYFVAMLVLFTSHFDIAHSQTIVDSIARSEIVHLKELIEAADKRYEQRFNAQESTIAAALAALEKSSAAQLAATREAVTKQEMASEKRLDSVNEFRGQLQDQAATFVTRTELYGSIMGIAGLSIGIVGLLVRKRESDLEKINALMKR